MRPSTSVDKIHNVLTKIKGTYNLISRQKDTSTDLGAVFSFFLPTLFFGFDKPVLAIANLTHLPLPRRQANTLAKSKKLNSLPHFFGFFKPILAIPKLSTIFFASYKAKNIKLNCLPAIKGVLCTFGGHLAPLSQKPKPQACGIFFFKQNSNDFKTSVLGFP